MDLGGEPVFEVGRISNPSGFQWTDWKSVLLSRGAAKANSQGRKPLEPESNTCKPR
jgi:hypothetical protein